MKTSVEQLDGNVVKLTVSVPVEEVDAAIDAAYKRIAKKIKIPGFRAGKAPKPIIDTHVGREAVVADAQDELLTETYSKALDAENLRPIAQPEVEDLDLMVAGSEFNYVAEVEVRPELTLSSTENLSVTVPPSKASDREIDAQIKATAERYASLEVVEDRGVDIDDFVLVSFVGKVDGEEYEGNTVDKYLYEMNRGLMPVEFDEGLIGVEAGGETQVAFDIPDTSSNPDFVGKTATFDVTVHEIKEKVLPEIDDEFASNVGGFDSLEELRDSVRSQLDASKEAGQSQLLETGARAAIAERLEGDVPATMIENVKGQMVRDFANNLESNKLSLSDYLVQTGTTQEAFESDIAAQAELAVREELALEALFRALEFAVTDEDIDEDVRNFSSDSDSSVAELRAKWEETGVMSVIIEQLMHKKAVLWLMQNVEIIEKDESSEAESADEGK